MGRRKKKKIKNNGAGKTPRGVFNGRSFFKISNYSIKCYSDSYYKET